MSNAITHGKKEPQMDGMTCQHGTQCLLGISSMDRFLHHRPNKENNMSGAYRANKSKNLRAYQTKSSNTLALLVSYAMLRFHFTCDQPLVTLELCCHH